MKNCMMVLMLALAFTAGGCTAREALIGAGAATAGAAAGYYAGDKYDVDVDDRDEDRGDRDRDRDRWRDRERR